MSFCKANYESKVKELGEIIAWRQRACQWIQLGRGACFLLFALAVIGALTGVFVGLWAYLVPAIPLLSLVGAAAYNETLDSRQVSDRLRRYINELQLRRLDRDWSSIPDPDFQVPPHRSQLATDLDLFGKSSLFKLLCTAKTPLGIQKLGEWILHPATPDEIAVRQKSVADLKDRVELRENLQLLSCRVSQAETDPRDLLEWAQGDLWLEKRSWLIGFSRAAALLILACGIIFWFPWAPKMIVGGIGLALLTVNVGLTVFLSGSIHEIFNSVGYRQRDVSNYVELFQLAKTIDSESAQLIEIKEVLATGRNSAVHAVNQLQSIIGVAQLRRSGLMFLVYVIFQFLFLMDVHALYWLEKWHKKNAKRVTVWLHSLATWESLSSLSNLAYHQPDWVFPCVQKSIERIKSTQVGHPLLSDEQRVGNDVSVGPSGSVLLVTGSNMSGKSTLLRSIGMNCCLAQAGSVVCANRMELPPLQLETSMRVGDSLADGLSFFAAELQRIGQITREAQRLADDGETILLFLLDEILQGTNSRERQIAVARICEHLLESKAIGAISTHDLELAEAGSLKGKCQTVHFREFFTQNEVGQEEMQFDYVMRSGIAPTTNALKLLEMVGLTGTRSADP
ncbi:MAG: hypothetical protein VX438_04770 [Planctomycetota bacterium]|nr:hypothetical protein [Planctomycetota bacterium]